MLPSETYLNDKSPVITIVTKLEKKSFVHYRYLQTMKTNTLSEAINSFSLSFPPIGIHVIGAVIPADFTLWSYIESA